MLLNAGETENCEFSFWYYMVSGMSQTFVFLGLVLQMQQQYCHPMNVYFYV